MWEVLISVGDCVESLRRLPDNCVHTCITSPPYFGLRDYGVDGQIGLEPTPDEFVRRLVEVFREVRRVLRDDGTLWLNLGDSYVTGIKADRKQSANPGVGANRPEAQNSVTRIGTPDGLKTKDLIGVPWRVAFALQADGWYLRQDIIWHKPNPMPESVKDRCTKSHEYIFMFSKSPRYFFDADAIKEPAVSTNARKFVDGGKDKQRGHSRRHAGFNARYAAKVADEGVPKTRNRRSVWTVATKPYSEAHFATFPADLIEPCVLSGCPVEGSVLDPFGGSGTTAGVAVKNGRRAILCELNPDYVSMMRDRIRKIAGRSGDTTISETKHLPRCFDIWSLC